MPAKRKHPIVCRKCGKNKLGFDARQMYCSRTCANQAQLNYFGGVRRVKRASVEAGLCETCRGSLDEHERCLGCGCLGHDLTSLPVIDGLCPSCRDAIAFRAAKQGAAGRATVGLTRAHAATSGIQGA